MNILKITLNENGKVVDFAPDFKVIRGSYSSILINIEVPKSLLLGAVYDEKGNSITGNNVRIGAIIRTSAGKNLQTKKYEFSLIKEFVKNETEYCLYQRKCPKEFTLWETVSQYENATSGLLEMVINVVNWSIDDNGSRTEEITATQIVPLVIYAGTYLEGEEIENPSDFDILHSQVQENDSLLKGITASLFGTDDDSLGSYLVDRLIAGDKIILEKDTSTPPSNKIKISLESLTASDVILNKVNDIKSSTVQGAIEELNLRTDTKYVDTLKGAVDGLVDNTDPYNPIILQDKSKADENSVADRLKNKADLVDGKVPSSQLPSYVDDVIEVDTFENLTNIDGEEGKIYVTLDTNITYRWSGSTYVEISKSLAIGETETTAFRGDFGKVAYGHSQLNKGNPHNVSKDDLGLSNVDNTSDIDKPVSEAQKSAINEVKTIAENALRQVTEGLGTVVMVNGEPVSSFNADSKLDANATAVSAMVAESTDLNGKTAKFSNVISNPSIIHNPDCSINTTGEDSYITMNGWGALIPAYDAWYIKGANDGTAYLSKVDNNIKMTGNMWLVNRIKADAYRGKKVTLTVPIVEITGGSYITAQIVTCTESLSTTFTSLATVNKYAGATDRIILTATIPEDAEYFGIRIYIQAGMTFTFRFAKLEEGEYSTDVFNGTSLASLFSEFATKDKNGVIIDSGYVRTFSSRGALSEDGGSLNDLYNPDNDRRYVCTYLGLANKWTDKPEDSTNGFISETFPMRRSATPYRTYMQKYSSRGGIWFRTATQETSSDVPSWTSWEKVITNISATFNTKVVINNGSNWGQIKQYSAGGHYRGFESGDNSIRLDIHNNGEDYNNRRYLDLRSQAYNSDINSAVEVVDIKEGVVSRTLLATQNWVENQKYDRISTNALTALATWAKSTNIPTLNTIAYWDGRYQTTGNSSNLRYAKTPDNNSNANEIATTAWIHNILKNKPTELCGGSGFYPGVGSSKNFTAPLTDYKIITAMVLFKGYSWVYTFPSGLINSQNSMKFVYADPVDFGSIQITNTSITLIEDHLGSNEYPIQLKVYAW